MAVDPTSAEAPLSNADRLAAVAQSGLLDTGREELFDRVTRLAARLLRAPAGAVSVVTHDRQFLKSEVGFPARWREQPSMPLAYSFCQHVVAAGAPVIIRDARNDARVRNSPAIAEDDSIAYLGVPVEMSGQVVGAFCVLDRVPRQWTEEDVHVLEELASTLLTAISYGVARRAAAESIDSGRRLALQNAAARVLARAPTLEAAATELLDTLCGTMGWHTGVLWQVEPDAGLLVCAGAWSCVEGESPFLELSRRLVFLPGVGIPGRVWQTGRPQWIPDLRSEPGLLRSGAAEAAGLQGVLGFPLLADGEVIGVLEFVAHGGAEPDHQTVEIMSALAAQIEPFVTRKRAEAEIRKLAAIVESSPDAIVATTPEGIINTWNRGAETMFGYRSDEVVGRSIRLLIPPERGRDLPWIRSEVNGAESVQVHETERVHRDGRRVWVSLSVAPILDASGNVVGTAGIARDIGEQRLTQERLRRSESELRAILSALPDAILVLDADGRIVRVAPNAPHLLVASPEAMQGRTLHDLLEPDEADRFLAVVQHVLVTGEKMTFEYTMPIAGRDLTFDATISAMDSETVIWTARDVTARVRAERQAHERQAQLAQAQKMDAIGRLAGGVAHDFNNLLTVIRGTVQLLMMDLPSHDPKQEDLRTIDEAGATAAALTAQLLTFSRKQPTQVGVLDLNSVVAGMDPLLRRLIGEHIQVATRLASRPAQVRADRNQMEQVILNLAVNARDAMPEGGRLLIETTVTTLPEAGRRHPARGNAGEPVVALTVSDEGQGMTPDVIGQVFEPFFTTKPAGEGTGLGLATVYDIVQQSGGWVEVVSEPGRGSEFRIYLPVASGASGPAVPSAGVRAPSRQYGARVLVVEDEKDVRAILRRSLERAGHEVLEAPTGVDALRMLGEGPAPDLVVSDGVLPDMRGEAVLNQVRARLPHVSVLMVSGYSGGDMGGVPRDVPFMQKPFSPGEFMARVAELLAARRGGSPDPGPGSRGARP